jgi:DNA-binding response OmpR family regulator
MKEDGAQGKVFIVDTNLLFVKRLSEALRERGFEPVHCAEAAYALTMIEWNMPVAIFCTTSSRESTGFDMPAILRGDAKTSHIPVIAIGDRGRQSQLEVLRAGYEDFLDRRLSAEEIAAHLVSLLSSHRDGFQPTQMLDRAETAMDGRLSLVDLPGVIQVLSQSRQTGGLHINADDTDGMIFFDAGEIIHAESGQHAGDDAIIQLVKSCYLTKDGVYKFIPGDAGTLRTVQGTLNALIMDALRDLDEDKRDSESTAASDEEPAAEIAEPKEQNSIETSASASSTAEREPVSEPGEPIMETKSYEEPAAECEPEVIPDAASNEQPITSIESLEPPESPDARNQAPELSGKNAGFPIIDEEALRELDEMLSNLNVEEEASHE